MFKNHPVRVFVAGLVLGLVVAGSAIGYVYFDTQAKSSAIIGQLRSEQQRSGQLVESIGRGLEDCLERERTAQGLFEKNRIILTELRSIVNLLPDAK